MLREFFGGKIRLTGDASKLRAMPLPKPGQTGPAAELLNEIGARVAAITL